jgi:hypothetical protein
MITKADIISWESDIEEGLLISDDHLTEKSVVTKEGKLNNEELVISDEFEILEEKLKVKIIRY